VEITERPSGLYERIAPDQPKRLGVRAFIAKTANKKELAELMRKVLAG